MYDNQLEFNNGPNSRSHLFGRWITWLQRAWYIAAALLQLMKYSSPVCWSVIWFWHTPIVHVSCVYKLSTETNFCAGTFVCRFWHLRDVKPKTSGTVDRKWTLEATYTRFGTKLPGRQHGFWLSSGPYRTGYRTLQRSSTVSDYSTRTWIKTLYRNSSTHQVNHSLLRHRRVQSRDEDPNLK